MDPPGRLRALARLIGLVSSSLDLDEVLREIVSVAGTLVGAAVVGVWEADEPSRSVVLRVFSDPQAAQAYPRPRLAFGEGLIGWVAAHRRTALVPDVFADHRIFAREWFRQHGLTSALALPLVHQDRLLGVLALNGRTAFRLGSDDEALVESFAAQAALAIRNARLHGEVRAGRDFLESITENIGDGIVTTDLAGRITYWSPGARQMLGYESAEVLGRRVAELYDGGLAAAREVMRQLGAAGRVRSRLVAARAKDGHVTECSLSVSHLRDAGGTVVGTLGVLKDVSDLKRLEAQLRQAQKMEAIGRLAGGVAHDFNNLLAVILGHSELLLDSLPDRDPVRADLQEIRQAAERAAALTAQLLAFGRRQLLEPRVLDLNEVLSGVGRMLGRLIGPDVELVVRLAPDLGPVLADRGQLEQVVMNLAVNARDAMPGGGRLTLETSRVVLDEAFVAGHPGATAGSHVQLAVSDTGSGMAPDVLAHVFEPFFTTKSAGQGTGLGLSMVYGIVKQHQGYIAVDSAPGQGTTFRIYLPQVDAAGSGAAETARPVPARGAETILLVEDEPAVRELVQRILGRHGYVVLPALGGDEALALAAAHPGPIHLLVTDVIMPHPDGREVAERLRATRPETPVLFLSGYAADRLQISGEPRRGVGFLQKPFTPSALLHKVRELLADR